jgi:hypothetical protein
MGHGAFVRLQGLRKKRQTGSEFLEKQAAGAKQAAEKLRMNGEGREKPPSGAKARPLFYATYGTTEVVP